MRRSESRRGTQILRRLAKSMRSNVQGLVEAEAERVVADAKDRVPVKTGRLQRSIRWRHGDEDEASGGIRGRLGAGDVTVLIKAEEPYAHLVEYGFAIGDKQIEGQPYLEPAVRAGRQRLSREMRTTLSRAVKDSRR